MKRMIAVIAAVVVATVATESQAGRIYNPYGPGGPLDPARLRYGKFGHRQGSFTHRRITPSWRGRYYDSRWRSYRGSAYGRRH